MFKSSTQFSEDGEVLVFMNHRSLDKVIHNSLVRKSLYSIFTTLMYDYLGKDNSVRHPPCVESAIMLPTSMETTHFVDNGFYRGTSCS